MGGRLRGFTLIEMLIVIFIIGLMMALFAGTVISVRQVGQRVSCQSNMRNLALALARFAASDDYIQAMPGNVHDKYDRDGDGDNDEDFYDDPPDPLRAPRQVGRCLRVTGDGKAVSDQTLSGWLYKLAGENKQVFQCPTFSGNDELGGNIVACHYAVPTILAGFPTDLAVGAFYRYTDSGGASHDKKLRGVPCIFEPLVVKNADDSITNDLGVYNPDTATWTTLPDGAFEQDDHIAWDRHLSTANIAFIDGHVDTVDFRDKEDGLPLNHSGGQRIPPRAQDFHMKISSSPSYATGEKTFDMGGANNSLDDGSGFPSWTNR